MPIHYVKPYSDNKFSDKDPLPVINPAYGLRLVRQFIKDDYMFIYITYDSEGFITAYQNTEADGFTTI